ncbi:hypothetical protein HYE82_33000 [Streptomyces sp. BR123]|uniref:hypothetical protein n=1 Tax=Streptomyces sp. BR123 TaxID=2749828 RepID=UPI0015C4CBDA|nr:hypothetical protein [Streptomyces sp. BR123]NXY99115.1 hypothetical protein [Streptomyces sp. BR123]
MTQTIACAAAPLPARDQLTWEQAQGRACVACRRQLTTDAVHRGIVAGSQGCHDTSVEVWSCPPEADQ